MLTLKTVWNAITSGSQKAPIGNQNLANSIPFVRLDRQYDLIKDELLYVTNEVLKSGKLVNGKYKFDLEEYFSNYLNFKHVYAVHSGTQALEIIAEANKLATSYRKHEYHILIPDVSYKATLHAFVRHGYKVTLVDVDAYGMMKWDEVTKIVESNPDTIYDICIVGLYGAKPYYNNYKESELRFKALSTISIRGGKIFEDGAQHWLSGRNEMSTAMAISLDPTKNLNASGNGGVICTSYDSLAHHIESICKNGSENNILATQIGTNSKLSEIDCAHVLVRSKYIEAWQQRRKDIAAYYMREFTKHNIENLCESKEERMYAYHSVNKFAISIENRDRLQEYLTLNGIETKIHYKRNLSRYRLAYNNCSLLENSWQFCAHTLSLPIYPELTDGEVEHIVQTIIKFLYK
jgi:dTDP-4-amino-4,6-dideoxygalactose transaminase